ncbi:glycosyltransferase family 2 protein [Patescibacteria group bacterium]|nr:glycosyltransferase family 2 protein [Patescibacteria group bacterium]
MEIYLSVVIPVYNEEKRIGHTIKTIKQYFDQQGYIYEVILVDDGSTDATKDVIGNLIKNLPNYKLMINSHNQGKGAVVRQGMMAASGQYILFIDADGATPINQIEKLLPYIDEYEVVFGSRHCPGGIIRIAQAKHRVILSRLSNLLIRWLLLPGICDTQCGFKLFQAKPAKQIFSLSKINRFGFDFEILAIAKYLGYNFKEIGVEWHDDPNSKVRAGKEALRTLRDLLKVKWNLLRRYYS